MILQRKPRSLSEPIGPIYVVYTCIVYIVYIVSIDRVSDGEVIRVSACVRKMTSSLPRRCCLLNNNYHNMHQTRAFLLPSIWNCSLFQLWLSSKLSSLASQPTSFGGIHNSGNYIPLNPQFYFLVHALRLFAIFPLYDFGCLISHTVNCRLNI